MVLSPNKIIPIKETPEMSNILQETKNKFNHISFEEREAIAIGLAEGKSQKQIAKMLNRNPSTISREIWRNGKKMHRHYSALKAQSYSERRKYTSHAKDRLKCPEIRKYVIKMLKEGWTPEQIAGRLSKEIPELKTNFESIYLYIYNDAPYLYKYLPRSRRKRLKRGLKKHRRISKIPDRVSINERPVEINSRSRIGDWEADTIISRKSKTALLVLRERLTHLTLIAKIPDHTAASSNRAIIEMLQDAPAELRKSLTLDNGSEFSLHQDLAEELNLETYFCNPYHSWEKGSVENTNGLIRRYYPKQTDFSLIPDSEIIRVQMALNNRPRKSLGFLTPLEALQYCA